MKMNINKNEYTNEKFNHICMYIMKKVRGIDSYRNRHAQVEDRVQHCLCLVQFAVQGTVQQRSGVLNRHAVADACVVV